MRDTKLRSNRQRQRAVAKIRGKRSSSLMTDPDRQWAEDESDTETLGRLHSKLPGELQARPARNLIATGSKHAGHADLLATAEKVLADDAYSGKACTKSLPA